MDASNIQNRDNIRCVKYSNGSFFNPLYLLCNDVQISPTIHFYFSLNWLDIKHIIPSIFRYLLFKVVAVLKRPFSSLVNSICMQLILQFFCALVPIPLFSNFRHFGSIYLFEEWGYYFVLLFFGIVKSSGRK